MSAAIGNVPLYVSGEQPRSLNPEDQPGLTTIPRREWPTIAVQPHQRPIDLLKPHSDLHNRVKDHLMRRLDDSERAMTGFHNRWRTNEMRHQAWLNLRDYDAMLKEANDSGRPPRAVEITIPYSFATLSTISTYLLQVFTGRRPHLGVGTYGPWMNNALRMEIVLQYQCDHNRIINNWWQWCNDMGIYGVGVMINQWRARIEQRTVPSEQPVLDLLTGRLQMEQFKEQKDVVVYEGNEVVNIDPFMFYPDPRVPMHQVMDRGEYVFWRTFEGKHTLKRSETQGYLKWIDAASSVISPTGTQSGLSSGRSLLSGGDPHPGSDTSTDILVSRGNYKVDSCSIDIIPRELGLGHSERVEKWLFTILNNDQIVQAERMLDDHGQHPVIVAEPWTMGYAFGSHAMSDYISPLQDSMSWFLNSHMDNTRKAVNDMFVVDPNLIELNDMQRPGPGKLIRLKKTALNRDVRAAVQQLQVTDVTRGHIDSMNTFFDLGQRISAVSENLLGLQAEGGRKTATEVRTSFEAAASRLASLARVVSAQGMSVLTRQMAMNTQQWMSTEFYTRLVGSDGLQHPLRITPDGLTGDFYYPIHDGTLPIDKLATLDIWKELFQGVLQDPELRQTYSVPKLFEFIAELGGAKNVRSFRLQPMSEAALEQQAQAGNMAPIPGGNSPAGLLNSTLPQQTGAMVNGPRLS